jgi:hypothetical protein
MLCRRLYRLLKRIALKAKKSVHSSSTDLNVPLLTDWELL